MDATGVLRPLTPASPSDENVCGRKGLDPGPSKNSGFHAFGEFYRVISKY